jgi:hypothetical protein
MIEIKAPNPKLLMKTIFIAGSIEMGAAENWQKRIVDDLSDYKNLMIFNPRRDDWNSSWLQTKDNPSFREQVEWELDYLEYCELIVLYFDPKSKSPISLLELGLFYKKMIVCCPLGFWRKGNVDIVCKRYHIPIVETYEELLGYIDNWASKNNVEEEEARR